MKKNVNTSVRDAVLAHLINQQRYANSEVRAMLRLLNSVDSDLFSRLGSALERVSPSSFTVKRLDAVLSGVWELNESAYRQLATRNAREMLALTKAELDFQKTMFDSLLPEGVPRVGLPGADRVYAATNARPLQGRLMSKWWGSLASGRKNRIELSLRSGYVQGLTVDEMIRTLRGTRAQNYSDGLLQIDRNHAEAVVRTAVSHTAQVARAQFYERNSDLIKEEQWISTLDNRTTDLCIARDGKRYTAGLKHEPIGHKLPWLEGPGAIHWQCRSVSVPVIDAAETLGLDLPPLERASMNGVSAPGTTYKEWLAAQPVNIQDDVLGKTRGKLFREGKLPLDKFFNDKGELLTLEQLREKDSAAFRKAGV